MTAEEFTAETERRFINCGDFTKRIFRQKNDSTLTILYIINLCDKKYITEGILKPLSFAEQFEYDEVKMTGTLATLPLTVCRDTDTACEKILSGNAIIIGEQNGSYFCYAADAKSEDGRGITEPLSETVVRGPRQGFVENAMQNLTMLRKIIRSENLKVINMTFGTNTNTDVKIVYYEGIARKDVLQRLLRRLSDIEIQSCVDSGYLELMLQNSKFNLFSEVGNSEKPDKVASKILGGRIAVICDGSPVVLTVPYLFSESLQSTEDYLKSLYYSTFIRLLRLVSLLISVYLPALYIAVNEFHKGILPYSMYKIQIQNRSDVPFNLFIEMLAVLFIFEIIREVGIRMPKAVGNALSVVGGLILGDAAIKAGITSETVIVIAALTGICNFMNPTFMNANVLLRFINLFLAKTLGFFGISAGFIVTLTILCAKKSFGISYMSPLSPIESGILRDTIAVKPYAASKLHKGEISKS